ncbi:MAG TPA: FAD-dependent monooxygenase [Methylomirabilota bacterium]|nr:FAD-dependent monooxygenase [Methylomirabilota bacterium]
MSPDTPSAPVVIAGAGPVGLALAVGLAHHGIESVVLEDDESPSAHSKAPGLLCRTLEIFRAWGVLDRFMEEGFFVTRPHIWMAGEETPRATIDFSVLADLTAVPGVLILPQNRTEGLLRERLTRSGLSDVRFGHRVVRFDQDGSGVSVRVERKAGSAYELRGHYLVGCDGAHSTVRETLGWPLEGTTYPTRLVLADVQLPDQRNDLPWPRLAGDDQQVLAAVRIEPRLWRVIATVDRRMSDEAATGAPEIARKVDRLFGPGSFECVWANVFRIHCRTSPHFRLGRVLLAGDAAHINSPAGGQGMNSGIQDAHNLAWKLDRALRGGVSEPLLASYEAERRPAILTSVDRYTDLLTRAFLLPPRAVRSSLARLARAVVSQPFVMRRLVPRAAMLDTRYRSSPLISGRGRWLGARAPDGPLRARDGRDVRLLDLARRDAALLLFDDGRLPGWDVSQVQQLASDVPGLVVCRIVPPSPADGDSGDLVDATGSLARMWQPGAALAALVRPDGYVGWMAERPSREELRTGVRRALGVAA